MTSSSKSALRFGPVTLDMPDATPRAHSSSIDRQQLEHVRPCAEALRLAVAARPAGLPAEGPTATRSGGADRARRQIRPLQKWRLKRVTEYVDDHLSDEIRLFDLAAVAGLSRMHFASQFRVATGLRPHEFLLGRRIRRSEELLRSSSMAIVEIALSVGFQTQAHFSTVFKRFVGYSPREWRMANRSPIPRLIRNGTETEISSAF
jgi:AraC family transcriptional regulator